ncbi:hypothetical protein TNCV_4190601 [Trichonephila clavipes]|nr:hypothetical protein TNCV_4190601 [Trichonephila clavipes]
MRPILAYGCPVWGYAAKTNINILCKKQLPAPGNRSNERRYREKDLATTEEKKVGTGEKREGDEKSRGREK